MGKIEIDHTGSGGGITLSSDGTSLLLGGTAIGGSALELYAENPSTPTAPSATGTNAVAIGTQSQASGTESVALGRFNQATNTRAFAAGPYNAIASGSESIAIGYQATASAQRSMAIGRATDATASYAVAIGHSGSGSGAQAVTGAGAMALGGSYASGTDSLAAAITNNTSSYGATGSNSIAIGKQNKATATISMAIGGQNNVASNNYAFVTGNGSTASGYTSVSLGHETTASDFYTVATGGKSVASLYGKVAHASGNFSANGDAQGGQFILRADTTDATATVLTTNNSTAGSTNQIVAASDTCIMFSGTIVAMQNGAQDQGGWEIKGLLKNDGGTTTLVSSNIQTFADGNGWTVALSADNTNNALAITCTGEAAHNIRWVANISTSEVTYA